MAEKQVLFRIDAKLLDALDRRIAKEGYTTRNAWFRDVVTGTKKGRGKRGGRR
jgi:metal-responsive CopG/Arc/MetJ family transcriptional regulator